MASVSGMPGFARSTGWPLGVGHADGHCCVVVGCWELTGTISPPTRNATVARMFHPRMIHRAFPSLHLTVDHQWPGPTLMIQGGRNNRLSSKNPMIGQGVADGRLPLHGEERAGVSPAGMEPRSTPLTWRRRDPSL